MSQCLLPKESKTMWHQSRTELSYMGFSAALKWDPLQKGVNPMEPLFSWVPYFLAQIGPKCDFDEPSHGLLVTLMCSRIPEELIQTTGSTKKQGVEKLNLATLWSLCYQAHTRLGVVSLETVQSLVRDEQCVPAWQFIHSQPQLLRSCVWFGLTMSRPGQCYNKPEFSFSFWMNINHVWLRSKGCTTLC